MFSVDEVLERELIQGLRTGDESSFNQIFDLYHSRLYRFLLRLSGNQDLTLDLLQETWIRLIRSAKQLREDTSLLAWLITVARNLYISHYRSRVQEYQKLTTRKFNSQADANSSSPLEETIAGETFEELEAALMDLPVHYREVIVLISVEGMSPSEIGTICRLKPAAVRQRLHRARKELHHILKKNRHVSVSIRAGKVSSLQRSS